MARKKVVVLGSTGSIGVNTLDVVRRNPSAYQVLGLAANRNVRLILDQIKEFSPQMVAIDDTPAAAELKKALSGVKNAPQILNHAEGLEKLAAHKNADVVISGVVGARGLLPLVAALKAGKNVGLANKEALVVAGPIIMALAKKHKARIIPVDSEHSAIFQCLQGHKSSEVSRILLTASGGPFYRDTRDLDSITVEEALNHPTWKMGAKITVDSATLMNKGLEAIEAHHLFGVPMKKIEILIHPQSIVHSLVEFEDGASLAQLSHPDMRIPIQYALTYPSRNQTPTKKLNLEEVGRLDFAKPDFSRFPALKLALEAGIRGGTAPAVLSASNEVAVRAFLEKKISFMAIPRVVAAVLTAHKFNAAPRLAEVVAIDQWARKEAADIIVSLEKKHHVI
jgi:1-deoxy-D-xylulose-5-phosphate reductoisomerase